MISQTPVLPMRCPERDSFTVMYKRYLPLVRQYIAVCKKQDHIQEEDILQDIFMRLWERREQFARVKSPEAYLFAMVHNRLVNQGLRASRRRKILQDLVILFPSSAGVTAQLCDYRETAGRLEAAVRKLPARMKLAYCLKHEREFTIPEIGRAMGISPHTARNLLRSANKKVKCCLL